MEHNVCQLYACLRRRYHSVVNFHAHNFIFVLIYNNDARKRNKRSLIVCERAVVRKEKDGKKREELMDEFVNCWRRSEKSRLQKRKSERLDGAVEETKFSVSIINVLLRDCNNHYFVRYIILILLFNIYIRLICKICKLV